MSSQLQFLSGLWLTGTLRNLMFHFFLGTTNAVFMMAIVPSLHEVTESNYNTIPYHLSIYYDLSDQCPDLSCIAIIVIFKENCWTGHQCIFDRFGDKFFINTVSKQKITKCFIFSLGVVYAVIYLCQGSTNSIVSRAAANISRHVASHVAIFMKTSKTSTIFHDTFCANIYSVFFFY